MNILYDYLLTHPIVYITRDIERALGLQLPTRGYYIVTNQTAISEKYEKEFPKNILIIKDKNLLDTHELLNHRETKEFLRRLPGASLLVFKNTLQIEKIAKENKWRLLNPSASLANTIEEKIEQVQWLGSLASTLPPHSVSKLKDVEFTEAPFVLQFNHAHSGEGTYLLKEEKELRKLKSKFPEREVKKVKFVSGPIFTSNNIVTKKEILIGNINYQITGLAPFTDLPFSTIGNDFGLVLTELSPSQVSEYKKIVKEIGEKLRQSGWKGLFGIDAVVSKENGKVYLIEINARQPAGSTFESKLQTEDRKQKSFGLTVFEAHLMSLLDLDPRDEMLIPITDGAQIVQRITKKRTSIKKEIAAALAKIGLTVLPYENKNPNSDLIRIQSRKGIMARHNTFNELGEKIRQTVI